MLRCAVDQLPTHKGLPDAVRLKLWLLKRHLQRQDYINLFQDAPKSTVLLPVVSPRYLAGSFSRTA